MFYQATITAMTIYGDYCSCQKRQAYTNPPYMRLELKYPAPQTTNVSNATGLGKPHRVILQEGFLEGNVYFSRYALDKEKMVHAGEDYLLYLGVTQTKYSGTEVRRPTSTPASSTNQTYTPSKPEDEERLWYSRKVEEMVDFKFECFGPDTEVSEVRRWGMDLVSVPFKFDLRQTRENSFTSMSQYQGFRRDLPCQDRVLPPTVDTRHSTDPASALDGEQHCFIQYSLFATLYDPSKKYVTDMLRQFKLVPRLQSTLEHKLWHSTDIPTTLPQGRFHRFFGVHTEPIELKLVTAITRSVFTHLPTKVWVFVLSNNGPPPPPYSRAGAHVTAEKVFENGSTKITVKSFRVTYRRTETLSGTNLEKDLLSRDSGEWPLTHSFVNSKVTTHDLIGPKKQPPVTFDLADLKDIRHVSSRLAKKFGEAYKYAMDISDLLPHYVTFPVHSPDSPTGCDIITTSHVLDFTIKLTSPGHACVEESLTACDGEMPLNICSWALDMPEDHKEHFKHDKIDEPVPSKDDPLNSYYWE